MTEPELVVIDTNVVLDLWGFADPRTHAWANRLTGAPGEAPLRWLATVAMRAELLAVLQRPHLAQAFALRGRSVTDVLCGFDAHAQLVCAPDPLPQEVRVHCTDADDQKFIDLALVHGACLLSKDKAVIKCKKRLAARGVALVVPR